MPETIAPRQGHWRIEEAKGTRRALRQNRGTWKANQDSVARATHAASNTRRVSVGRQKNELGATHTSSFTLRSTTNTMKNARMVELLGKHSSRKSSRCLARSVFGRLARIHRETIDILSSVKGSNLNKFAVISRSVCVLHMDRGH